MILVTRSIDPRPTWLPGDARAVRAGPYVRLDNGQGGVVRGDINVEDIQHLAAFTAGEEVFVESEDEADVLDDTDDRMADDTRIWWRASVQGEVVGDAGAGGASSP
jgi:hypothetical protein